VDLVKTSEATLKRFERLATEASESLRGGKATTETLSSYCSVVKEAILIELHDTFNEAVKRETDARLLEAFDAFRKFVVKQL
jgi:hypothetical protein